MWRRKGGPSTAFYMTPSLATRDADLDASGKIEPDLESFPLPREIRKRLGRRNLNVFRDISDMTGNRWRFPSRQAMNRGWRWRTAT